MEKKSPGFNGKKYLETSLEDHKDKWVLITLRNNLSYIGKLIEINKKEIGLLPYQKTTYDKNENIKYVLVYEGLPDARERMDIIGYRPSSEEEAINYCRNMNRKSYLESLKERKELFELEKQNQEISNLLNKIVVVKR